MAFRARPPEAVLLGLCLLGRTFDHGFEQLPQARESTTVLVSCQTHPPRQGSVGGQEIRGGRPLTDNSGQTVVGEPLRPPLARRRRSPRDAREDPAPQQLGSFVQLVRHYGRSWRLPSPPHGAKTPWKRPCQETRHRHPTIRVAPPHSPHRALPSRARAPSTTRATPVSTMRCGATAFPPSIHAW